MGASCPLTQSPLHSGERGRRGPPQRWEGGRQAGHRAHCSAHPLGACVSRALPQSELFAGSPERTRRACPSMPSHTNSRNVRCAAKARGAITGNQLHPVATVWRQPPIQAHPLLPRCSGQRAHTTPKRAIVPVSNTPHSTVHRGDAVLTHRLPEPLCTRASGPAMAVRIDGAADAALGKKHTCPYTAARTACALRSAPGSPRPPICPPSVMVRCKTRVRRRQLRGRPTPVRTCRQLRGTTARRRRSHPGKALHFQPGRIWDAPCGERVPSPCMPSLLHPSPRTLLRG